MSCLTLLCLWFSCELWRQSTNQDVSVHSLSLLYTLTVSLHNFWVHDLGCWPASEPCLRRAALVLVPKNVEESQSRKDMQKLRPNSTSFLIPKKVKEDVRWRGLPGQRAMSGRRCLMCVPRMLFKNNVWTEQHGNGSSQTYFKPLMLSWFVCFVKIGFYMIGQAKHALVVGTLSKLQLMLGTGMPRHRCSRKGCPAYINPHHLPTSNHRWWKRYRSHSSANTVCFALSVAQWHLAPCHPSRSPHQPQGHWGHGEQAEPSSQRLGWGEGEIHRLWQWQDLDWRSSRWGYFHKHRLERFGRRPCTADHLGTMVRHCSMRCSTDLGSDKADSPNVCPESAWSRRDPEGGVETACYQAPMWSRCRPSHRCGQVVQIEDEWCPAWSCPALQKACQSQGQVGMEIAHVCSHDYAQGSKDWSQIQDQRGYANCRPCLAFSQRQDSFKSTQPGGDPFAASEDPQCSIRVLAQERGSLDRKWHPLCLAHGQNPCLIFVWRSCKKRTCVSKCCFAV